MTTNTILGQHKFDGPYSTVGELFQRSGVYIISTALRDGSHKIIDVGESGNVQTRVSSHDRAASWNQYAVNGLYASAHYCDEFARMILEQAVRTAYKPSCGER